MRQVRTVPQMRKVWALSARLMQLVRSGKAENAWDQEQLLARIAALETELARYATAYGLTPEARRLFAHPPLPRPGCAGSVAPGWSVTETTARAKTAG